MCAVAHRALTVALLLVPAACTEPNPYLNVCGNGVVEPAHGEECDDGASGNDDGAACTSTCRLARCGDGLLQEGVELCDAGTANDDQGRCTRACAPPRCGDGIVQLGEICDDGPLNTSPGYGAGCSTECRHRGRCGDGILQAPQEACDDGNQYNSDACLSTCAEASCGDGFVHAGVEACDDGNQNDDDACTAACAAAVCGDGFVHAGVEACDDGNADNTDACLTTCAKASCGDGHLWAGVEKCDDGNLDPDDGCNHLCIPDRLVFITEGMWNAKGIVGLDGGDLECHKIAKAFGDPDPVRFYAWLSDGVDSPDTRFIHSKGRYVLPTGEVIADDWDDLTDGTLQHPIDRTRGGDLLSEVPVFTATRPDGTALSDRHCDGWKVPSMDYAGYGYSDLTDGGWTDWPSMNPITCSDIAHLYCFEAR